MKVYIPYFCRSEEGLVQPLIKKLKESNKFTISFDEADIILIVGDRLEVFNECVRAFLEHKFIIHVYAGIKQYITTYDDILRHCISLMSNMQLVESRKTKKVVKKLFKSIGKKYNIKKVGITHLDDLELDDNIIPKEPYNLILYNPTTLIKEIFIGPNPDISYSNLPRSQFLSLLKHCNQFISNSSSSIYEAPFFIKKNQIVFIGKRNKYRPKVKCKRGGTKKIMKIINSMEINDEKENC